MTSIHQEHPPSPITPTVKRVDSIHPAPGLHWVGDGFRVAGYFSAIPNAARRLDPFLLLDYHPPFHYPPTRQRRGVGVHPHRGFETVTLAWQGSVAHHDSAGGGGVIGPNDVQWMTAASGILHKEYHEEGFARTGGPFHMAQLWVNLPRQHKMDPPRYQGITADQMGVVPLPDGESLVRVIAGEYQGVRGPAKTFSPINVFDVRLAAGGKVDFNFPARQNTSFLVMKGGISLQDTTRAKENDFILFQNAGEHIAIKASSEAHLLLLNGEPLGEPIAQYGPFVMNTEREIHQAFADFNGGKFGHLED